MNDVAFNHQFQSMTIVQDHSETHPPLVSEDPLKIFWRTYKFTSHIHKQLFLTNPALTDTHASLPTKTNPIKNTNFCLFLLSLYMIHVWIISDGAYKLHSKELIFLTKGLHPKFNRCIVWQIWSAFAPY